MQIRWIIGLKIIVFILLALIPIQYVTRKSLTILCYIDIRYSRYQIDRPHAELWNECRSRYMDFPFGL